MSFKLGHILSIVGQINIIYIYIYIYFVSQINGSVYAESV